MVEQIWVFIAMVELQMLPNWVDEFEWIKMDYWVIRVDTTTKGVLSRRLLLDATI